MKKMISLALGAAAVLALSGCNTTGDLPTGLEKVDIYDLQDGYIIDGYDINGNELSLYFCYNNFDLERAPNDSFSGIYDIEGEDILFKQDIPEDGSYYLYTSDDDGYIYTDRIYDFESTLSHAITVTNISQDNSYDNYACR